jgi:hypothetical protein
MLVALRKKKMPEKKNNHYIPKLILKHWVTKNSENRNGVYVLDTVKNRSYFSSSEGKRAFSFAIGNDLYVPKIEDERRVELEDWFGGLELTLDKTILKLNSANQEPLFQSQYEMTKFVLALFSFKHRTRYVIEKHRKYLEENPDKLKLISERTDYNKELILLENIVNATTHDAIKLSNFEMVVMKSKGKSLIMGDMPFLENIVDGFNFLPLTNKVFIGFRSIRESSFYDVQESGDKLVESLNYAIASNSKYWIVADNKTQIEKYEEELKANLEKEPIYTPITFTMRGSTFK